MSKKPEQKKQEQQKTPAEQPPAVTDPGIQRTTPIEQAAEQDRQAPTTMKIKPDTKARLDILKGVMKIDDYDAVVCRLIDNLPTRLSTEEEVHLVLPVSKYRWLMAHQDSCDCRTCLNNAKV